MWKERKDLRMTVADLIKKLQELPQNLNVYHYYYGDLEKLDEAEVRTVYDMETVSKCDKCNHTNWKRKEIDGVVIS